MAKVEFILSRPNFLASEVGLRTVTYTFAQSNAQVVTENNRKIIKAGTVYPTNDESALGIVFQDVDVTDGDRPEALMVGGRYLKDKLASTIAETAVTALAGKGLYGETSPIVSVPADGTL